jgi:hypothetical protein
MQTDSNAKLSNTCHVQQQCNGIVTEKDIALLHAAAYALRRLSDGHFSWQLLGLAERLKQLCAE